MKIDLGIMPSTFEAAGETAKQAESLGFDGLWSAETSHDPFFPLVVAARETDKIQLATGVAIAFPRSPMVLANISWDLQANSNGRFVLGLGTQVKGHNERRFSVKWESPVKRLREVVLALRAIWKCWQNDENLDFRGNFYNFSLMTPFFNPGPIKDPKIPIVLSGLNPRISELAGELSDGFFIHNFHTRRHIKNTIIPNIHRGLAKADRTARKCPLITGTFVATGANRHEVLTAMAGVRKQIGFYASTKTYKSVLDTHGWGEACFRLNEKAARGEWETMSAEITDEMLDEIAVTGTYDEIGEKLVDRYEGILDRLILTFDLSTNTQKGRCKELLQDIRRHAEQKVLARPNKQL